MGWDQYSSYETVEQLLGREVMRGKKITSWTITVVNNPMVDTYFGFNYPIKLQNVRIVYNDGSVINWTHQLYKATNTDDSGCDYFMYYPEGVEVEPIRESYLD